MLLVYVVHVAAVQWAAWDGVRKFEAEKHDYLQGQIGNPGSAPLSCAPGVLCPSAMPFCKCEALHVATARVEGRDTRRCLARRGVALGRLLACSPAPAASTHPLGRQPPPFPEPDAQTRAEGADKPNKKFYDPRVWIRKSEESAVERLGEAFADLNSVGVLA